MSREAAALVLTQDGHGGATYELVGTRAAQPERSRRRDRRGARARACAPKRKPVEAWDARARAAGMGEHERATLAAMFRYYAKHGLVGNPNTLRWLLGRPPNGLSVFLSRVAAATSDVRS